MVNFLLLVLVMPFAVIALLIGAVLEMIREAFNVPLLAIGLWLTYLGMMFFVTPPSDPAQPFASGVEVLAHSRVFSIETWLACLGSGALLILVAFFAKLYGTRGAT